MKRSVKTKVTPKTKTTPKSSKSVKVKASDISTKAVVNVTAERQQRMAEFYAAQTVKVENDLHLVSNSIVEPKRVSSGVLQIDWIYGGGFVPGMSSTAGAEQSGKTTLLYHTLATAHSILKLPYTGLYDAEGSVSPKYTGKIWEPFGMDVKELLSKVGRQKGFYYFRNQVIETMFDYLKQTLSLMPDKNWSSEINSWAYYFPKRNDQAKKLMQIMQVKVDKTLSAPGNFYICPTDYDGPEGFFGVDSFAALLTREEEEKDESGTTRSAMEASEFSKQLKRVKVDLAEKKVIMLGTNQLRSHVRKVYGSPDDQEYESGGNALKFYSEARTRNYSRSPSAASKFGPFAYDKESAKFGIEDSVEFDGTDRYAYKEVKNTKNKFGKPGLKSLIRIWVSDAKGNPRGIDPVFDAWMHLRNTGQLKTGSSYSFKIKDGVGKKRASLINSAKPFKFPTFKKLVIAEYTNNNRLLNEALKELGLARSIDLRASLFRQMVNKEEDVYSNIRDSAKTENEEMEDGVVEEDYEDL